MGEERVRTSIEEGVAEVTLARPEKRNGLDRAMFEALSDTGERLKTERGVRAVVLSGEGQAFCAGLDFQSYLADREAFGRALLTRRGAGDANLAQHVAWVWQELDVPVVAAIHGACFGGGLQIALGADIRLARPDARLCVMEVHYGLVPDMGASKTLLRLVRDDIARELTFTGRQVAGQEAASIGLVTRTCEDPRREARAIAASIATLSPDAIRRAKRLFREAPFQTTPEAFALEERLQRELLGSPNQIEAGMARMQGRAASFRDPD